MYFTPRGKDLREQKILDFSTAQKFLEIAISGKNVKDFFVKVQIHSIAIAPFNHFGKCMARMLKNQGIEIKCFMDKMYFKYGGEFEGIPIIDYTDFQKDEVDAIIVVSNYHANAIMDTLVKNNVPLEKMIGINTILYGMERLQ